MNDELEQWENARRWVEAEMARINTLLTNEHIDNNSHYVQGRKRALTEVFLRMPRAKITCPRCGRTSYNADDIKERYCGSCDAYHDTMYTCLDCGRPSPDAGNGGEVTCAMCGGFRMVVDDE